MCNEEIFNQSLHTYFPIFVVNYYLNEIFILYFKFILVSVIYAFRSNASGNKNNFEMFFFLLHCLTDVVLTAIQYYIYILHTVLEKKKRFTASGKPKTFSRFYSH